jgi:6-phosphogluconate dehydrogenase
VQRVEPILLPLAVDGGYVHAGPSGAGHFTKLVHNGIEFGMLQAIKETGEVNWLVDDALQMEVATPVIAAVVMQLIASRDESEPWARAIAMMRKDFGGHTYGASEAIVEERRTGRVGGFVGD